MYLRNIAVGLAALVLVSTAVDARGPANPYTSTQQRISFDGCAELFPAATPINTATVPASMRPMALCSDHFAVLYSQTSKTPLVVVERLNAAQLNDAKGEERTNQFYPDPRIPKGGRAELSDYRSQHPAMDRGHQSPAADAPNAHAMAQSFALSNMVPQDPTNNRKIWSKVEADVRKFAKRAGGDVYVFTGPLFDAGYSTIGDNKVWVPTRLFKLVYDASSKRAWAYVLPNAETRIQKPMDYDTFVKSTGLKLLGNLPVTGSVGRT
ncbi:endonuclease [Pseudomonas fluorescens]|uniref:DNA/RNA non-specific endonuclease n=1 Tax=Pseudomonas TaxID=286 RepID=UPI00083D6866|nr:MULTISPECIES: DNA/RNA non-specific endonuclease [Pseudomonas]AOE68191.1 endonuclease [Pseudomonas fluorescens]AOE73969.1 endonuclease [Pseudomonas fluorescens]MDR6576120.1 endonuclease G [Pseudomonas extremaustralis]WLD65724.1 DNA/RNA non-specific endonuclease [Pseudomonas sp. OVF7]